MILDSYGTALTEINEKIAVLFAKAKDIAPADMYNWTIQYNRLTTLRDEIAKVYKKYDKVAERLQIESFNTAFNNQYYRSTFTLEWNEPLTFATLDAQFDIYALTGDLAP